MAYKPGQPIVNVNETAKTRWRAVPYTAGRGLDLGCGAQRLFETEYVVGLDNGEDADIGLPGAPNLRGDARDLGMFAAGHWDYVYSSYLLQYFPYEQIHTALREWLRVVKTHAYVSLYLPDAEQYPKVGTPQAHPKQKWDVTYDLVTAALEKTAWNFDLCHFEKCDQGDEYSLYFVVQKLKLK